MAVKRGLVLAGGGIAGIAWETGVLAGIGAAAPATATALLSSDVLLGTSAGSTVAAQLSSGLSLGELFDRQLTEYSEEIDPGVSVDAIAELFVSALQIPGADRRTKLQRVGEVAVSVKTVPEAVRRNVIAARLPSHDWPDRDLRITAVDIETGDLVVFDRGSGVGLVDAVAASCAVPGAWPPVTIGAHRYIDGGVVSSVNMAAVADCTDAVVLAPSGEAAPSPWGAGMAAEIAEFAGASCAVFADDAALAAFGPNPLDPSCRTPAAQAGYAQGHAEAQRITRFLDL